MEKTLAKINRSAVKFLAPLELEETYKIIVNEAVKMVGASYGSILLQSDAGDLKRVYASKQYAFKTVNRKKANTYKCFTSRKALIVPISELGSHHPEMENYGIRWTIFIPLFYQNKSIGVITINTKNEEEIDKKDMGSLKLFGMFATLAILNAQSRTEVKRTLESRDLFIALASHELKTPLTAINGYIQLLSRKITDPADPMFKWISSTRGEINRLIALVKELLEVDQIKTGKLNYSWSNTDLNQIIEQAVSSFSLIQPNRQIIYKNKLKNKSGVIMGDSNKLLQVILNVIQNAMKYSEDKIEITLFLKSHMYVITIKDFGVGIDDADKKKVFKDFYKGSNNNKEGLGLGLFLTKHIIDSHKGKIDIISEKNIGTTVLIMLPAVQQDGAESRINTITTTTA